MNGIVAKSEAVLGFMLFKGWKLEKTNEMYYVLIHPSAEEEINEKVRFHIPRNNKAEDFDFQINNLVNHIARLYHWDKTLLLLFLSVKPDDIDTLFQEWLKSNLQGNAQQSSLPKGEIQVSFSAA